MARYVSLINWTDQGVRGAKDTVKRTDVARQAFEAEGGRILDAYWTLGPYDVVLIFEAPDDETATRLALKLGMNGNSRTTTMRAFGEPEMARIVQGLA
ncbi:MAG: GYD domain-containing protein [Betaproteobacteria bacterium]|nr:GYD domain-containing protein [Betaproteobacteria bacterium]